MSFLSIVIALGVEYWWERAQQVRSFHWFRRLVAWGQARITAGAPWDGPLGVLAIVALPGLAVGLGFVLCYQIHIGLAFLFATVVLFWSLGPQALQQQVQRFLNHWERGDEEMARASASGLVGSTTPAEPSRLMSAVVEAVLWEALERLFAVLFWFLVLGPLGAALYRLVGVLVDELSSEDREVAPGLAASAAALHGILAWVPVRVVALGYAVAGDFVDTLQAWQREVATGMQGWQGRNRGPLVAAGLGALSLYQAAPDDVQFDTAQVRAALGLVRRTLLLALILIAVVTLAGWLP